MSRLSYHPGRCSCGCCKSSLDDPEEDVPICMGCERCESCCECASFDEDDDHDGTIEFARGIGES